MFNSYHLNQSTAITNVVKKTTNVDINLPPLPKVSLVRIHKLRTSEYEQAKYQITFNPKHPVFEHFPEANKLEWRKSKDIYSATWDLIDDYDIYLKRHVYSGRGILVTEELSSEVFSWTVFEDVDYRQGQDTCGTYERMYDDLFFRQQDLDNSRLTYQPNS